MKLYVYLLQLVALVVNISAFSQELDLNIVTIPRGPVYPAATWIRVGCKQDNSQSLLQYRWLGSCNSTGEVIFNITDPFLDEESWAVIWVKSTPLDCLDHFQCTSYDNSLTELTSKVFTLDKISGVGLSLPDNFFLGTLPNNSAVVFNSGGMPQAVLCHSGLRSNGTGQWMSPVAMYEGDGNDFMAEFNFVKLDLKNGTVEGIYTCIIEDENEQEQKLYIGAYQSVPEVTIEPVYHITSTSLILECITTGLPATAALWSRDNIRLENSHMTASTIDSMGDFVESVQYKNTLELSDSGNADKTGLFSCDVYSDWVTADQSNSGRKGVSAYFVIWDLSDSITIECAFPEEISGVEWMNESSSYAPDYNNTAKLSLTVTEDMHGKTYVCRGRGTHGYDVQKHYIIIVNVPNDALMTKIKEPVADPIVDEPYLLTCCANKSIESAISSEPILNWFRDDHLLTPTQPTVTIDRETCVTINFTTLTVQDEGMYSCIASLQSSRMEDILVQEDHYELVVFELKGGTTTESLQTVNNDITEEQIENKGTTEEEAINKETTTDQAQISDKANHNDWIISINASILLLIVLLAAISLVIVIVVRKWRKYSTKTQTTTSTIEVKIDDLDTKI